MIGGLLAANVASWIGLGVLEAMHPLPEVAATAVNATAEVVYMISGFSILGLFIALLYVNSRRWKVAMLVAICGLLVVSGVTETWV